MALVGARLALETAHNPTLSKLQCGLAVNFMRRKLLAALRGTGDRIVALGDVIVTGAGIDRLGTLGLAWFRGPRPNFVDI
mmetsp:Transcript_12464/g.20735  ORF Transcript_12464/g.20735 Transcript_12464/m.20735 type:complete len:80 (+) Transcript_12464:383-622(+)